jgi:hypothetical protein
MKSVDSLTPALTEKPICEKRRFAAKRLILALIVACALLFSYSLSGFNTSPVYAGKSIYGKPYNDKLILPNGHDTTWNVLVLESFYVNGKKVKVKSVDRTSMRLQINTASNISYILSNGGPSTFDPEDTGSDEVVYTKKYSGKKAVIPRSFSFKIIATQYVISLDSEYDYLDIDVADDGKAIKYWYSENDPVSAKLKSPKIKSVRFSGKANKVRQKRPGIFISSSCKSLKKFTVTKDMWFVENNSKKTRIKIAKNAYWDTSVFSVTKLRKSDCNNKKWWNTRGYYKFGKYHVYHVDDL